MGGDSDESHTAELSQGSGRSGFILLHTPSRGIAADCHEIHHPSLVLPSWACQLGWGSVLIRGSLTPLWSLSIIVQPLTPMAVPGHRTLGGVSLLGLLLSDHRLDRLEPDLAVTWSVVEKGGNSGLKMAKQGLGEICSSVGRVFA